MLLWTCAVSGVVQLTRAVCLSSTLPFQSTALSARSYDTTSGHVPVSLQGVSNTAYSSVKCYSWFQFHWHVYLCIRSVFCKCEICMKCPYSFWAPAYSGLCSLTHENSLCLPALPPNWNTLCHRDSNRKPSSWTCYVLLHWSPCPYYRGRTFNTVTLLLLLQWTPSPSSSSLQWPASWWLCSSVVAAAAAASGAPTGGRGEHMPTTQRQKPIVGYLLSTSTRTWEVVLPVKSNGHLGNQNAVTLSVAQEVHNHNCKC